ncbi:MAG: rhomboid family intramembrane serine protease [Phycisphaerales bacterium]|jgi:membrane associated rhomboid family serine protease|nr:rhomboid family intramembrane serine protease [Phycisphaerales bacterium]
MLIPIGSDIQHKHHPTVTYGIICLNLIVFALQWSTNRTGGIDSSNEITRSIATLFNEGVLSSTHFHIFSLITYQFLHASWWHILGNMIFLLPFGKAVEDRMGHIGFASFYLLCGAIGGGLQILISNGSVVGASGSVCAVTAAFIVLAPKTKINVLFIFFIIGIYKIPSMLFVMFFILFDTFSLLSSYAGANTAPTAWFTHLGGYASGFAITFTLLSLKLIKSTQFDLTEMLSQSNRRRSYKQAIAKKLPIRKTPNPPSLTRASIIQSVASGNIAAGANQYLKSLNDKPPIILDQKTHVQIGNFLINEGRIEDGVNIHEKYLEFHKDADNRSEIALLIAAKYARHLNNSKRAKELLNDFANGFSKEHEGLVDTLSNELNS